MYQCRLSATRALKPPSCRMARVGFPSRGSKLCAVLPDSQIRMEGASYEDVVEQLAHRALGAAASKAPGQKHIIGIAGVPGSGKSTLSSLVMARLNELAAHQQLQPQEKGDAFAMLLPMDGFHLYRRELDALADPEAAYARRGAPWTFNAEAFVSCVRRVREQGEASCPGFAHGPRSDPVEGEIQIRPDHRIVLVEGNYLLLDTPPWDKLRQLFDDIWYVDISIDTAMERVFQRQTGQGKSEQVSRGRIEGNDRPNAEMVDACKGYARVLVPSSIPLLRKGTHSGVDASML